MVGPVVIMVSLSKVLINGGSSLNIIFSKTLERV
jgi:hypothetical protein